MTTIWQNEEQKLGTIPLQNLGEGDWFFSVGTLWVVVHDIDSEVPGDGRIHAFRIDTGDLVDWDPDSHVNYVEHVKIKYKLQRTGQ